MKACSGPLMASTRVIVCVLGWLATLLAHGMTTCSGWLTGRLDCVVGRRCTAWNYHNATLQRSSMMYESCGRISFVSGTVATDWHGSWDESAPAQLRLLFHWNGNLTKIKPALLFMVGRDGTGQPSWQGYDYAGRQIYLEHVQTWQYCE